MDNKKFAEELLEYLGGADNVKSVFHCFTRLRFTLRDTSLVQEDKVQAMTAVLNARYIGELYAVVVGDQVRDAYAELAKYVSVEEEDEEPAAPQGEVKKRKINPFSLFIGTMSSVVAPVIISICGSGLIKGAQVLLLNLGVLQGDSVANTLLTLLGSVGFYWMPMYIAAATAKKYKCNQSMALLLAGILMHPVYLNMAGGAMTTVYLFDAIPIPIIDYSSQVIPILAMVYALSKLEKFLHKVVPDILKTVAIPLLEIIILGTLSLVVIGPVLKGAADLVASAYMWLYNIAAVPASALFAAAYPFLVMMGIHTSLGSFIFFSLAEFGVDYMMPLMSLAHCGLAASALAVYIRTKNKKLKGVSATGALITGIGLTEPALYGVFLPFKKIMAVCLVVNAIGGAFFGWFRVSALTIGLAPLGSIPIFFTDTFVYWVIGSIGTAVLAFIGTLLFGYKPGDENTVPGYEKTASKAEIAD